MPADRVKTDDSDLVRRCKEGDDSAFSELIARYQDRVYNMAYRFMGDRQAAEDMAQEVFLKVFRNLAQFEEKAAFSTWIYRITANQCTSEGRRLANRHRRQEISLTPVDADSSTRSLDPGDSRSDPAEMVLDDERAAMVQKTIDQLDPEFREALVLRDIEGLPYEEIAEIIERPVGTVRSRIHRARLDLRERLRKYMESGS